MHSPIFLRDEKCINNGTLRCNNQEAERKQLKMSLPYKILRIVKSCCKFSDDNMVNLARRQERYTISRATYLSRFEQEHEPAEIRELTDKARQGKGREAEGKVHF